MALSFWLIGFPAAYVLAFNLGTGAAGVWIGLSLSVFVYAILLIARLLILLRRPDIVAAATTQSL